MKEIIIILDNIRSALNVGAIFRTCDGAAVKKIYLIGITPQPGHQKLIKTALGAEKYIEWEYCKNIDEIIDRLVKENYRIYSVEQTSTSIIYSEVSYPQKTVLIFGHEITGVSATALEKSKAHIQIPMLGKKNSLNVSTCVGIIIYYIRTQDL